MLLSWRWFGKNDPISLREISQTGAKGIVSALHDCDKDKPWEEETIAAHQALIKANGLEWTVVESVPVNEAIKLNTYEAAKYIDIYKQNIRRLAKFGIKTICYNFMPIVDWTRTDLSYALPLGGTTLRFDMVSFVCYDVLILQRQNAAKDYSVEINLKAEKYFNSISVEDKLLLEKNIIAGLPGADFNFSREEVLDLIAQYSEISEADLQANLIAFLQEIIPVAKEVGVNMCIHPDDPPFSLFGLPRAVKNIDDLNVIFNSVPDLCNGLTLCAGSFGAIKSNNVVEIAKRFADRTHFTHLRNVTVEDDGSFIEAEHLDGEVNMAELVAVLLTEQNRRAAIGREDAIVPMRPDHGHLLLDDQLKPSLPGYSLIGRLKGLSELRGVINAVEYMQEQSSVMKIN